jgi:CMP-N-acetylneuraminic acid synthetase
MEPARVSRVIVIPARGGSKGVPRKNLQMLNGTPLIVSAISRGLAARADRVIVSTEDSEIRELALSAGAEVPFVRPMELASDSVSLIDVLRHAVAELGRLGDHVDTICSLQPTAPFLSPGTLERCLMTLDETGCDSVVTVRRVMHNHPYRTYSRTDAGYLKPLLSHGEGALQRQDLPEVFALSGGFFVRRSHLVSAWGGQDFALGRRCAGIEVTEVEGLNIDSPLDLAIARCLAAGSLPQQAADSHE